MLLLPFANLQDDFYTYTMNEAARLDSVKDEARVSIVGSLYWRLV